MHQRDILLFRNLAGFPLLACLTLAQCYIKALLHCCSYSEQQGSTFGSRRDGLSCQCLNPVA